MKRRDYWTIEEIINLKDRLYPLLGWKGYGDISLATNNCADLDLWLFMNVNSKKVKIREVKKALKEKFPEYEFHVYLQEEPTQHALAFCLCKGDKFFEKKRGGKDV